MITVRAETATDYTAVHEVNKRALGGEGESRLVEALRKSPHSRLELSVVTLSGIRRGGLSVSRLKS